MQTLLCVRSWQMSKSCALQLALFSDELLKLTAAANLVQMLEFAL